MKLKEVRTQKRWRQNEVAAAIGVTASAVHHWESGANKPSYENLEKLSKVLGCTVDELIGEEDDRIREA